MHFQNRRNPVTQVGLTRILLLVACVFWGCQGGREDLVLAKVGDTEITAAQLRDFASRLPESVRTKKASVEGHLDYLQTLIDKELMLREARKRGLDEQPEFRRKLDKEKDERVLRTFLRREVHDKIAIEEQELQNYQVETGRDRAVKVRRIAVPTRSEAEEIRRALEEGGDFAEFAPRTLLESTALEGGKYLIKDEMYPPILQEMVFPLQVGEISEPVDFNNQYGIYQVIDEIPVKLGTVRSLLEAELVQQKIPAMVEEFTARLQEELDFHTHREALQLLGERIGQGAGNFSEAERATVLYQFKGGTFTIGDFLDGAQDLNMSFPRDTQERGDGFTEEIVVPRIVLLAAAYAAGIDGEAEIVQWLRERKQALLLLAMRRDVVSDVFVDESEARWFYDRHPEVFSPLEAAITVQEILVRTEEEAASLIDEIAQGGDLATLAETHTLRRRGIGHKGKFHIHRFEKLRYGDLLKAAQGAEIGQLVGPVEVTVPASQVLDPHPMFSGDNYYSIFKILESTIGVGPEPFSKVERRARALVRREKQNRAFHQFLLDLRHRYEPQIEVYEDNVGTLPGEEYVK